MQEFVSGTIKEAREKGELLYPVISRCDELKHFLLNRLFVDHMRSETLVS